MSTPTPVTGYILAGGSSRRLGRDKATLRWPQTPISTPARSNFTLRDHMQETLARVCDPVYVVGRHPIADLIPGLGPLGGIATALHLSATADNIIVAVDL